MFFDSILSQQGHNSCTQGIINTVDLEFALLSQDSYKNEPKTAHMEKKLHIT